ncbi:MAG: hypothetical protein ACK5XN_38390, partial [Bacteroidota bacterium]
PATCWCAISELLKAQKRIKELESRIAAASITLYDWDGYFDAKAFTGNAPKLAALIEDAYIELQGRTWTGGPRLWGEIHRREDAAKKTKKKGRKK